MLFPGCKMVHFKMETFVSIMNINIMYVMSCYTCMLRYSRRRRMELICISLSVVTGTFTVGVDLSNISRYYKYLLLLLSLSVKQNEKTVS
jgi:hypothetical protein